MTVLNQMTLSLVAVVTLFCVFPNETLAQKDTWTIAVISSADARFHKLARGWVGARDEIDLIIDVSNLNDMAEKLIALSAGKKISRLYFFGHGSEDGSEIQFMNGDQEEIIGASHFQNISDRNPSLPKSFAPGARLTLISCNVGMSGKLVNAMGNAFFRENGGSVEASTTGVRIRISQDTDGEVIEWQETPDSKLTRFSNPWTRYDIPQGGRTITPPQKTGDDNTHGKAEEIIVLPLTSDMFFKDDK